MTDQLDRLFADLRAETIAEVRPPGVGVARRTVRRRRLTAASAAGLTVLAVAGLASVLPHRAGPAPAEPAPPGILNQRGQQASLVVGMNHTNGPADVMALHDSAVRIAPLPVVEGTYIVKLACVGPGTVVVTVNDTEVPVPCGLVPHKLPVEWQSFAPDGRLEISVEPDAEAAGRTAVAYQVELSPQSRTELIQAVNAAILAGPGEEGSIAVSHLTGRATGQLLVTPAAGRYRVDYACAGLGTAQVGVDLVTDQTAGIAKSLSRRTLVCERTARVESATITVPAAPADELSFVAVPSASAAGLIIAAFRVVKL